MNPSGVFVEIDNPQPFYMPGDTISGSFRLRDQTPDAVKRFELSVLWHTTGKGYEDMGIHYFEKHEIEESLGNQAGYKFSTRLPNTPFSYDGTLLQIHWCVRVRAFLRAGGEWAAEVRFRLGNLKVRQTEE